MPTLIRRLTGDILHPVDYTADSLNAAAAYEPTDGVYTVTNTYPDVQVLKLDAHLDRLEDSARRIDYALTLDRLALRSALRQMISESGFEQVRFRITASPATPDSLLLTIEPFTPPAPDVYRKGVHVVTIRNSARANAAAKTTEWMHNRADIEKNLPSGIYTAILMDATHLLEGISSNFYGILNDELRTAGEGVLGGISQQIVLEVAAKLMPVRLEKLRYRDIPMLSDAFITSASRGIVPVVKIDQFWIATNEVGKNTSLLMQHYNEWVRQHLEPL